MEPQHRQLYLKKFIRNGNRLPQKGFENEKAEFLKERLKPKMRYREETEDERIVIRLDGDPEVPAKDDRIKQSKPASAADKPDGTGLEQIASTGPSKLLTHQRPDRLPRQIVAETADDLSPDSEPSHPS